MPVSRDGEALPQVEAALLARVFVKARVTEISLTTAARKCGGGAGLGSFWAACLKEEANVAKTFINLTVSKLIFSDSRLLTQPKHCAISYMINIL